MADRPLSIDIRHPILLKANDLGMLTREDGVSNFDAKDSNFIAARDTRDIPGPIPGFGLFFRHTCYLASYALRLHGMVPLLLMASDSEGIAAQMNLTNSRLSTANGRTIADHTLDLRRTFLLLGGEKPIFIDTLSVRNFSATPVMLPLSLQFSTTFESMFVPRGAPLIRPTCAKAPTGSAPCSPGSTSPAWTWATRITTNSPTMAARSSWPRARPGKSRRGRPSSRSLPSMAAW